MFGSAVSSRHHSSSTMSGTMLTSIVAALVITGGLAQAQTADAQVAKGAYEVRLTIEVQPGAMNLTDSGWVAVVGAAAKKVIRDQADVEAHVASRQFTSGSAISVHRLGGERPGLAGEVGRYEVAFVLNLSKGDANKLVKGISAQLETVLGEATTKYQARLKEDLQVQEQRITAAKERVKELVAKERKLIGPGGMGLDAKELGKQVSRLRRDEPQFRLEFERNSARIGAIRKTIVMIAAKAELAAKKDPVGAELKNIVALREQSLKFAREAAVQRAKMEVKRVETMAQRAKDDMELQFLKLKGLRAAHDQGAGTKGEVKRQELTASRAEAGYKEWVRAIGPAQDRAAMGPRVYPHEGEIQLAQARAKLAERIEAVRDKHSAKLLEDLNKQLTSLAIRKAEYDAMAKHTDRELKRNISLLEKLRVHGEALKIEFAQARIAVVRTVGERGDLTVALQNKIDPSVSVVAVEKQDE